MLEEIERTKASADLLYGSEQVEAALDDMASAINQTLAGSNPVVLCVMNGGIVAAGKLLPRLNFALNVDSIIASRYQNQTTGSGIEWKLIPSTPLQGRTVLIIDDILDEGLTLAAIIEFCRNQGAGAVYSAVLVDKNLGCVKPVRADFVGLAAENRYLFGYGMDYKGYLRNAPGIYACKETL